LAGLLGRFSRISTTCGGTPDAARIERTSAAALAPAMALLVPVGTSIRIPPVASRRQSCAKASTWARWLPVSVPRLSPMNSSTVRGPSESTIGWRWRTSLATSPVTVCGV
jgi:hypothetical protein